MRMTNLKAILKTAVLGATVLLLGAGVADRAAADQPDRRTGQRNHARRLVGADVGLHLRRGRDRLNRDLRRVEPQCGNGLVAGGDHRPDRRSRWARPSTSRTISRLRRRAANSEHCAHLDHDRGPGGRRPWEARQPPRRARFTALNGVTWPVAEHQDRRFLPRRLRKGRVCSRSRRGGCGVQPPR